MRIQRALSFVVRGRFLLDADAWIMGIIQTKCKFLPVNRQQQRAETKKHHCITFTVYSNQRYLLMSSTGASIASIVAFFTIKVATSIDDLLWLSPFLAIGSRHEHDRRVSEKLILGVIYVGVSMLVTVEALGVAYFAKHGIKTLLHEQPLTDEEGQGEENQNQVVQQVSYHYWKASRILSVLGAIFIAFFAWKEYKDEHDNNRNDSTEETSPLVSIQNEGTAIRSNQDTHQHSVIEEGNYGTLSLTKNKDGSHAVEGEQNHDNSNNHFGVVSQEEEEEEEEHVNKSFFVVVLFGTLDTLAVLASILTGLPDVQWLSVVIGTLLATVFIMLAAWCITLFTPFVDFVQRIPLWALMALIACYVLLSGLLSR